MLIHWKNRVSFLSTENNSLKVENIQLKNQLTKLETEINKIREERNHSIVEELIVENKYEFKQN